MEIDIWKLVVLGIAGIASGWINVLAGGGSLLTVPIMLFIGLSGPESNGTNRIGIIFQNIFASFTFFKRGISDHKLNFTLSLCAVAGALVGASVGVKIEGKLFNYFLIAIMVGVMFLTMKNRHSSSQKKSTPTHSSESTYRPVKNQLILGHLAMLGVGFWGGLIQIGVGLLFMPVLNRIMGFDLVRTNMYKVTIALIINIVALSIFVSKVDIFWMAGLVLGVGTSIGGYLGAHTSVTRGDTFIKKVLNLVIVVFIIKLLWPELSSVWNRVF